MKPTGKLEYFISKVDGQSYPCAVCATDSDDKPKPLIVEVSPQGWNRLPQCVETTEKIAAMAVKLGQPCVVLRAIGRGNGSLCQHYGEVDVFEAIEHVKTLYAIDPDRISVTGFSMGGAAVWYLISHYPDFFASAVPWCGYCDYRLWQKAGGLTIHMDPWEEPAWVSKSAVFMLENLRYTPTWIVHGEWDRAPAGVPVEHSRQMARLMGELGHDCKYSELPKMGHDTDDKTFEEVLAWMLSKKKIRTPEHLVHAAYTLRHNSSYWATIEQFIGYGKKAVINASRESGNKIAVKTENIRAFSLSSDQLHDISIDGFALGHIDLRTPGLFIKEERGAWAFRKSITIPGKKHGVSGPIGDMFFANTLLVFGTTGAEEENYFLDWFANIVAPVYYRANNGGVHRGGMNGDIAVKLRVVKDSELTQEELEQNSIILFGTHATNSVLAGLKDVLPISFKGNTLSAYDKVYASEYATFFGLFPHPYNSKRYIAVHGGVRPDSLVWGGMLNMNLLPDYIVYSKTQVLDWGFLNNDWKTS